MEPQGVSDDSQVLSVKLIEREREREREMVLYAVRVAMQQKA